MDISSLLGVIDSIPPLWQVAVLSLFPLTELRLTIPLGILQMGLPIWQVVGIALLINYVASVLVYLGLVYIVPMVRRHWRWFDGICEAVFTRTRKKTSARMADLGHVGLLLFVAIPLPGSGGWTGALVGYLFGVKFKHMWWILLLGLAIAALIVTGVTLGIGAIW